MFSKLPFILLYIGLFIPGEAQDSFLVNTFLRLSHVFDVTFSLYRQNSTILNVTDDNLIDLDKKAPFKFIVHGFTESPNKEYVKKLTKAYLKRGNYNVVVVDWADLAAVEYGRVTETAVTAASEMAIFIVHLWKYYSVDLDDIHLIGHSIGGHVVGIAGREVYKRTGIKVGRITSLDPAGPLYEGFVSIFVEKLEKGDAKMVDVIHTDGGAFGYAKSLGTVDFFPNGGIRTQPGCGPLTRKRSIIEYVFCSHKRSHAYYTLSINSNEYVAVKCDSWEDFESGDCDDNDKVIFGEDTPHNASGNYYLRINGLNDTVLRRDILRIRQNTPFQIPGLLLDETVADTDIVYYLYSRQYNNITIGKNYNYINRKYPIKMLVHGWTEHSYVAWCKDTISAYMKKGFYNIISLDWSSKGDADYLTASRNAKPVGNKIGEFLVSLHERRGVPYKNVHLISHSLGCHVAGFIGKRVYEISKLKIGRITALDPAAPIFDLITTGTNDRLSKDDARFVDIIHTDGGMLGFNYPIGTVDFFPNGGSAVQPGCSLMKIDVKYEDFFCSHASSHQLFINSINSRRFTAKPCESWEKFTKGLCDDRKAVVFGEDVPQTISGNFYLETNESDIIMQ